MSDIIVTSSNAVDIVNQLPKDEKIVFGPDRHLGRWVERQTGREMVLWPGFCIVHEQFNARRLATLRASYPEAKLIAHPECEEAVLDQADYIGSTLALLKYVRIEDLGGFGHKVDAAEDDHLRVGLRGRLREGKAVADMVGQVLHVGILIVVRQNDGVHLALQPRDFGFEVECRRNFAQSTREVLRIAGVHFRAGNGEGLHNPIVPARHE
jgi:hypothetical protein